MKSIEVVAAILLNAEGRVLIARRKPHKEQGGKWELPGGKVEEGEPYADALARELREEFGVSARTGKYFMSHTHDYPGFRIILHGYFAEITGGLLEPADHDRLEWIHPADHPGYDVAEADKPFLDRLAKNVLKDDQGIQDNN
jgi:8-oxo-dGTP diphosphatase